jgi:hypothetical protein
MKINDDFKNELIVLKRLNNSFGQIINNLSESNITLKYFQSDLEGKLIKFFLANLSILKLVDGVEFELLGRKHWTRDIFSINSITRMQIENFIMINYLFFENISEEEKDLRYDIYKLHGLIKQHNFKVLLPENQKKKDEVFEEMSSLKTKISESSIFKQADNKVKEKYLKPKDALLIKRDELFSKYELTKLNIDGAWRLYSNQSHSEHIGDRQYNYYYKIEKSTEKAIISSLMNLSILTNKLIFLLINEFESSRELFSKFPLSVRLLIEKYKF